MGQSRHWSELTQRKCCHPSQKQIQNYQEMPTLHANKNEKSMIGLKIVKMSKVIIFIIALPFDKQLSKLFKYSLDRWNSNY